jgi:hypothetical protein
MDDDVIRLGRDPRDRETPLRTIFPWWYLVGAVVSGLAIITLHDLSPAGTGIAIWGGLLGGEVATRRKAARAAVDEGRRPTRRDVTGPPIVEPLLAGLYAIWVVGFAIVLGNVIGITGPVDLGTAAIGAALLVGSSAVILAIVVRGRLKRRRQKAETHDH